MAHSATDALRSHGLFAQHCDDYLPWRHSVFVVAHMTLGFGVIQGEDKKKFKTRYMQTLALLGLSPSVCTYQGLEKL